MEAYERPESADEYGRRSGCFRDHRRRPFRFTNHVPVIHASALETASDGLVDQPDLRPCSIAWPAASLETLVDPREEVLDHPCSSPLLSSSEPLLRPRPAAARNLFLPVDELDLGSVPDLDVQHVFQDVYAKQNCYFSTTWLPLTPVEPERDEGLAFPLQSCKLHSLLRRELDLERVASPDEALRYGDVAVDSHQRAAGNCCSSLAATFPALFRKRHVEVVTPPLSPVSESHSPFVPGLAAAVIDLTSEPTTPSACNSPRADTPVRGLFAGSDVVASSSTAVPSPSRFDQESTFRHSAAQDIALDVPLVSTNSDPIEAIDLSGHIQGTVSLAPADDENFLNGNAAALLGDEGFDPTSLVEQEQLNPTDSIARVDVPVMDFLIPQPSWIHQAWTAREHLSLLEANATATFQIPLLPKDGRLDDSLKWMPFCREKRAPLPADELDPVDGSKELLIVENSCFSPQSVKHVPLPQALAILDLAEDVDIQEPHHDESRAHDGLLDHVEAATIRAHRCQDDGKRESLPIQTQQTRQSSRYGRIDGGNALLPLSGDSSATTTLLSGFMELRAIKRPRLQSSGDTLLRKSTEPLETLSNRRSVPHEPTQISKPASIPQYKIPEKKGPCIVSVTLEQAVLRHLEKTWPSHLIFDRDYSQHNQPWPPGSGRQHVWPVGFEADISMSPSRGVMVTTLVKAKQKPLPGSSAQTPLRERVQKTSQRYQSLVVLVSETNPAGEFSSNHSSSDMAAYADFVRFAASLDAEVTTYLVPGAEKTLSEWILCLLCRQSSQSSALGHFVSSTETSWDLFLRRAGFNVFAAQVLSRTLAEDFGNAGLAQFLAMPTHVKVSKFSQLIGGERVLAECCEVLDRGWA